MQTSKQVVKAAITFDMPDRVPVIFKAFGINDVHKVKWNYIGAGDSSQKHSVDEWGCAWERTDVTNMGQVTGSPLLNWSALGTYRWIDPDDPALYRGMEEKFAGSEGKYIITSIFMLLFERMHSLRGFENLLLDLYTERERIEKLADRIVDIQIGIIEGIAERFPNQIDGITFTDDWGTERNLFIRPEL